MPIYCFYWGDKDDEQFRLEIEADVKEVEKLLNEYRESDPKGYNNVGFMEFLESKGIEYRDLSPDYYIYF